MTLRALAYPEVELGGTGIRTPPLGVGTWPWGDRRVWRFDPVHGPRDAEAAFRAALACGVRLFDTAEIYGDGESERLLGRFMRVTGERPIIATKYAPLPRRFTTGSLPRALEASLGRLGIEYVDLYQIHWPYSVLRIERLMDRLADAVQAGKTRAVGVSNYGADEMRRARRALAARGVPLASNQVSYHLLDRSPEANGVLDACRELGVILIAYSPLALGALSGKYRPGGEAFPFSRRLTRNFLRFRRSGPVLAELDAIAARTGATTAQIALRWLMAKPGVVPIPSARNEQQARENARALESALDPEDIARLDRVSRA